jgi:transposase
VDPLGSLIRFVLLPGQRHDTVGVEPLIRDVPFDALMADKAFDVDWLRAELNPRATSAVIPPKANRKRQIAYDREIFR